MSSSTEIRTPTMNQAIAGLNMFELVIRDHQIVRELIDYFNRSAIIDEKQLIVYHIIRELSQHSAAEEMTWYLKLEEKLGPRGKRYFDQSVSEHQKLKEDLDVLNNLSVSSVGNEFDQKFIPVIKDFNEHTTFEETSVLPDLKKVMTQDEVEKLTEDWLASKSSAPTRPHPSAGTPARPMQAKAIALADKTADLVRFGMEKGQEYSGEPTGVAPRSGAHTGPVNR